MSAGRGEDPNYLRNLETRRDELYGRLEAGYLWLEQQNPVPTEAERFWVKLLREYEYICDELQKELAGPREQVPSGLHHKSSEELKEAFFGQRST